MFFFIFSSRRFCRVTTEEGGGGGPGSTGGGPITMDKDEKRMRREIDATQDPQQLRELSKDLLQAWFSEKASTNRAIRDQLGDG